MSFDWNDIAGNSLYTLKEQCNSLSISTKKQSTKRELIQTLQNYRDNMNLNKIKASPLSQNSRGSSSTTSGRQSPVPSIMTPISTTKPSFLYSSSHQHVHRSHKGSSVTPVKKFKSDKNHFSVFKIIFYIFLVVILFSICSVIKFM